MPTEEPTADAWVSPVNNSPFDPASRPEVSPPDAASEVRQEIRHNIGLANDALQRALDQVPDMIGRPAVVWQYIDDQLFKASTWIAKARAAVGVNSQFVDPGEGKDAADQPPTADMVPNVPVEDVTEGGAA